MDGSVAERSASGRKGNLTGSARKLKDNAADWHNHSLKWDRLNDEGFSIATKIVNMVLNKEPVKESNIVMEGESTLTSGFSPNSGDNHNKELEEQCNNLQAIVDKMTRIVSKMEKMASSEHGICELEEFQFGEKGRPAPLFQTWSTLQFAKASSKLLESYKQELLLKQTILQELAHTTNPDLAMVYLSSWLHQPYIEDTGKLLLESVLMETGHRAV